MNKITYLNGVRWHRALIAGVNNVLSRQDYLNKINVFPVPDGDTGTNMAFTLNHIIEHSSNKISDRTDQMLITIADAALDGARGNSGAILAQFFQGLSDGSKNIDRMTPESFVEAIKIGAEYARQALAEPKEGTILTILTDFSNELILQIKSNNYDFEDLLKKGLTKAEQSLKNTPELLPILKKSGVVDAGAQGFVDLLHGIYFFVINGDLRKSSINYIKKEPDISADQINNNQHKSIFRYCTECLIENNKINHKELKKAIQKNGDSLVLAGSKTKVKVHIHVNNPKEVFKICNTFGTVHSEKADDMWKQQLTMKNTNTIALVTDSGADIPENINNNIHIVPVRYNFGNKSYIDKISQTPEEFYKELAKNPHHPQTSQPTPGDFRRQYQYLQSHYRSIISIHLPHKISGTYQSAVNASKRIKNLEISIIDSYSASVGLGLIVLKVAKLIDEQKTHDEIMKLLPKIIDSTKIFLILKDLNYIVKGGRLPNWVKKIADIFCISPILTTKVQGQMTALGIIKGKRNFPIKMSKYVLSRMDANISYNVSIGHGNNVKDGNHLKELILKGHNNIKNIYLMDIGCALGVHAGPGSLAIAFQTN